MLESGQVDMSKPRSKVSYFKEFYSILNRWLNGGVRKLYKEKEVYLFKFVDAKTRFLLPQKTKEGKDLKALGMPRNYGMGPWPFGNTIILWKVH